MAYNGPTGFTGPTGSASQNLSQVLAIGNSAGATGINMNNNDITGIKAIGNASFNYGMTGQYLISSGPSNAFNWYNGSVYVTGTVASVTVNPAAGALADITASASATWNAIPSPTGRYKVTFNVSWQWITTGPPHTGLNDIICWPQVGLATFEQSSAIYTNSTPYVSASAYYSNGSPGSTGGGSISFSDIINLTGYTIQGQTIIFKLRASAAITAMQINTQYFIQMEPLY